MLFCFQALADNPLVPALGYHLDKLDRVLDHCGNPVGITCYLPDNSQGEDNLQDFLGMCGLPVVCTPYWPESSESILLTKAAACDPDIVEKLDRYVAGGGKALVTSGFLAAAMDGMIFTGLNGNPSGHRCHRSPRVRQNPPQVRRVLTCFYAAGSSSSSSSSGTVS